MSEPCGDAGHRTDVSFDDRKEHMKEDEGEVCCRICRCGEEDGRPLFHPCKCTGSIKYVHEECLMEWLSHIGSKNKSKCELCGHYFSFVPIYSPDAPSSLSLNEMLKICFIRFVRLIPTILRTVLVVLAWGILVPFSSCIWFRWMSLSGSSRNAIPIERQPGLDLLWQWFGLSFEFGYYASWCTGVIVTGAIVSSFLAVLVVFDYVHGWNDIRFDDLPDNGEVEAENVDDMDTDVDESATEDESDEEQNEILHEAEDIDRQGNQEIEADADQNGNMEALLDDENQDNGDDDNAELFEQIPAVPAEDVVEINLALDEFVGMRGPILILLHNVTCLILFNCIYLCVVFYCPTTLGAVIIQGVNRLIHFVIGLRLLSDADESFLLRTDTVKSMNQCINEAYVEVARDPSPFGFQAGLECQRLSVENEFRDKIHWAVLECASFGLGHISLACAFGASWLISRSIARYSGNRMMKKFWKRVSDVFETFGCTMKVAILVVLKMMLFPIGLGILLERSTQSMFSFSTEEKLTFILERPVYAGIVFWVAGITHMLVITVMVIQLRDVLHKDVLQGIIRPNDPNTNLMRILLVEPISNHIRRIVVSCAIYTLLVVLFAYAPLRFVNGLDVFDMSWWPLKPTFSYICLEVQLPVELAVFHLVALHVLDYGKASVYNAQVAFVTFACNVFGLTRYLLPCQDPLLVAQSSDSEDEGNQRQKHLLPRVKPSWARSRVFGLLCFSWAVSLFVTVVVVSLPYVCGSVAVKWLHLPLTHDPYIYFIGWFVIWRACVLLKAGSLSHLARELYRYIGNEGYSSWEKLVAQSQWLVVSLLGVVVLPWLIGTLLQIGILIPSDHSSLSNSFESTQNEWGFGKAFGLYFALLRGDPVRASESSNWLQLPISFGDEWIMGVAVLAILEQVLTNRDIVVMMGPKAIELHANIVEAINELQQYRCSKLLNNLILPLVTRLAFVLSATVVCSMLSDCFFYGLTGVTLCEVYGIVTLFRKVLSLVVVGTALPRMLRQARSTLSQLHDALRDEKYLVGRQLLNMEKRMRNKPRSVM